MSPSAREAPLPETYAAALRSGLHRHGTALAKLVLKFATLETFDFEIGRGVGGLGAVSNRQPKA